MSRSYGQYCGLARALDVVGDRWNLLIVRQLLIAPARYRELVEGLPGVATNLLARVTVTRYGIGRHLGPEGLRTFLGPYHDRRVRRSANAMLGDAAVDAEYLRALDRLAEVTPDLWLPAVPVHGQNANLYDRDWDKVLEQNRMFFSAR